MRKILIILAFFFVGCASGVDLTKTAGPPSPPPQWKTSGTDTLIPVSSSRTKIKLGTGAVMYESGTDLVFDDQNASPMTLQSMRSAAAGVEVVDATVGAAGDTDTTNAYSKDDIHDYVAQHDSDYDGLPDGVEAGVITAAMVAADVATQAELDTVAALVDTDDEIIAIINASPSTQIGVTAGGTGAGTFTDGGLLVGAGAGPFEALAVGLTTQILVGGGAGTNPAWGTDLPTAVTIGSAYIYRAGGTDVADADVADDITVSNYLPLSGASAMTGELTAAIGGIEFQETDTLTDCSTFAATGGGIFYDDSEGKFKKCQDNVLTDLDTSGGTPALSAVTDLAASKDFNDAGYTLTHHSATDGWGGHIIETTVANNASPTVLLTLQSADANDPTNVSYLKIIEDSDGTPVTLFDFKGRTLTLGTIASIEGIATLSASTSVTSPLYDVSGAAGITFGSADVTAFTFSGQSEDLVLTPSSDVWTLTSSTGATSVVGLASYSFGAAGVKITGDGDGAITLLGLGDGSDEDLTINLDDTADTVVFSSSTGVTSLNFSAINLVTTGTIQAGVNTNTDADGMTQGEMTTAGVYGTMFWAGGAGTWNLPAVATGMSVCVYSTTAAAVVINPDNADRIILDGTALADGDSITSASAAGDFICLMVDSANGWTTLGRSGTWTDTN